MQSNVPSEKRAKIVGCLKNLVDVQLVADYLNEEIQNGTVMTPKEGAALAGVGALKALLAEYSKG